MFSKWAKPWNRNKDLVMKSLLQAWLDRGANWFALFCFKCAQGKLLMDTTVISLNTKFLLIYIQVLKSFPPSKSIWLILYNILLCLLNENRQNIEDDFNSIGCLNKKLPPSSDIVWGKNKKPQTKLQIFCSSFPFEIIPSHNCQSPQQIPLQIYKQISIPTNLHLLSQVLIKISIITVTF